MEKFYVRPLWFHSDKVGPVEPKINKHETFDSTGATIEAVSIMSDDGADLTYEQLQKQQSETQTNEAPETPIEGFKDNKVTYLPGSLYANYMKIGGDGNLTKQNHNNTATVIKVTPKTPSVSQRIALTFDVQCIVADKNAQLSFAKINGVEDLDSLTYNKLHALTVTSINNEISHVNSDSVQQRTVTFDTAEAAYYVIYTNGAREMRITDFDATAKQIYHVTVTGANGTVDIDPEYAVEGDTVTLTPHASSGFDFKEFTVSGGNTEVQNTDGTYKFTMPASDVEITATFEKKQGTPAGLKLVYTTGGDEGSKINEIPEAQVFTAEDWKYVVGNTVPASELIQYQERKLVDNSDGTYTVYVYKSGLDDGIELGKADEVKYVTMEKVEGKYYYYQDFSGKAASNDFDTVKGYNFADLSSDANNTVSASNTALNLLAEDGAQKSVYSAKYTYTKYYVDAKFGFGDVGANKKTKLSFLMKMTHGNTDSSTYTLAGSDGAEIVKFTLPGGTETKDMEFSIGGQTVTAAEKLSTPYKSMFTDWVKVEVEVDFSAGDTADVTLTVKNANSETVYVNAQKGTTQAKNLSSLSFHLGRGFFAQVNLDDIAIQEVTE